jgi:hypothetical protein
MKILVFTDAHFGEDSNYEIIGGREHVNIFGSQFPKLIDELKLKFKKYDLIVNLGDSIINKNKDFDIKKYEEFIDMFKEVEVPMIHLFGNHDIQFIPQEILNKFTGEKRNYYSKDIGGIHHIILTAKLKNVIPNIEAHIEFDPYIPTEQIEWLREDIEKTKFPVIVYTHFSLTDKGSKGNYYFESFEENMTLVEGRQDIRKVFEDSKKVLLVLNGHMHFYNKENINGIDYVTLPSICENDGTGNPTKEYLDLSIDEKNQVSENLMKI